MNEQLEITVREIELEECSADDWAIVVRLIELKKRSFIGRLIRFPFLFLHDYRILRHQNDVLGSLIAAYHLSTMIFEGGKSR